MESIHVDKLSDTSEIGTPRDYSDDMYRFYFEVGEYQKAAGTIIQNFLGPQNTQSMISLPHGYEVELPIQCIPDLVKELVKGNIGIYQIVRYAKINKKWQ